MLLSEAIMLDASMGKQIFGAMTNDNSGSCALGSATLAVGQEGKSIYSLWPWMNSDRLRFPMCPECKQACGDYGSLIALHLNDSHHWTREKIADYVATVEPQESELTPAEAVEIFCESMVKQ